MTVETWTSAAAAPALLAKRPLGQAIKRGLLGRCPNCGEGRLFGRYLKVVDACAACGEDYTAQRADDLPPYITIVIVGHIVIPLVLWVEKAYHPEVWIQMTAWLPLTLLLTLLMLQPVKGGVVGLQWANYMHGFDPHGADDADRTYRSPEELARGA